MSTLLLKPSVRRKGAWHNARRSAGLSIDHRQGCKRHRRRARSLPSETLDFSRTSIDLEPLLCPSGTARREGQTVMFVAVEWESRRDWSESLTRSRRQHCEAIELLACRKASAL